MKSLVYSIGLILLLASCQAKPDRTEDVKSTSALTSVGGDEGEGKLAKTSMKKVVEKLDNAVSDSTEVEGTGLDCYVWTNTYLATTVVEDEEGDKFDLTIAITLKEDEQNEYSGTIHMYLSGCEDQMFKGTVKAKAQKNYVTVFFDENVDGMEEMFKKNDKLVQFEISYGEYVASWFAPMNDYVDEYTVLSLQK